MPALAKLSRPRTYSSIGRPSLYAKLDALREHPVIWVSAPPGSGKTTLVSDYIEARKLRAIWYQIDSDDNDIATFFYYMKNAVLETQKNVDLPSLLPVHREDISSFCRLFFRAVVSLKRPPHAIVIDNYHELSQEAVLHQLLETIAAELPAGISLIIISRSQPPTLAAVLYLNGQLVQLSWEHLQLSIEETRALITKKTGRIPSDQTVTELLAHTNGWAAGVALGVEKSAQEFSDDDGNAVASNNEQLFDYFATQLLRQTSPELKSFLLKTSLLTTMNAESALKLTGHKNSAEILDDLYRRGLFTSRRSLQPPIYQYHDLFRAYLNDQLRKSCTKAEFSDLQKRTGLVLEELLQPEQALRLYLSGEEWNGAQKMLMMVAPILLATGRSESLRGYLSVLPKEHADNPWMNYWLGAALARIMPFKAREPLINAWHMLKDDDQIELRRLICADIILTFAFEYSDFSPIDEWCDALLRLLENPAPFSSAQAELHVYSACAFALGQRVPRVEATKKCVDRIIILIEHPEMPPDLASMATGFLLVYHFSAGSLSIGRNVERKLRSLSASPQLSPMAAAMASIQLGHYAIRTGELDEARSILQVGLEIAKKNAISLKMLQVFSNLGLAFCAIQQCDIEQAERNRQAMEAATSAERITDRVAILRIHLHVACQRQQWELAWVLAEKQLVLARECGLFVVLFESHILMAYLCAKMQKRNEMEAQLSEVATLIQNSTFNHFLYHCDLVRAYFNLVNNDKDEAKQLLQSGLNGFHQDEGRFMLRMQPAVLSLLLNEALRADVQTGFVLQVIQEMRVPAPERAAENWPWPIRVFTLGRFEVRRHNVPLEFSRKAPKKTLALLKVIIALGPVNVSEQRVMDIFWPDEEGDVAVRSLTAALHRLRTLLSDDEALIQQGGMLSLNMQRVWVDAIELGRLLQDDDAVDASTLLGLYRGNFLIEDDGEPWSVTVREKLKSRFVLALNGTAQQLEMAGEIEQAIACYQRGLEADPIIESFYQGLMRCYTRMDRRSEAIAAYRRLKHILSITLSLKPSADTEQLYQSLRLD